MAGVVVGALGLAISYLVAGVLGIREWPMVAVGESIRDISPQGLVEWAKETFGTADKLVVIIGMFVFLTVAFGALGRLARDYWWGAVGGYAVLAVIAGAAVISRPTFTGNYLAPLLIGFLAWLVALAVMAAMLRNWELADKPEESAVGSAQSRRAFFLAAGAVGGISILSTVFGKFFGNKRAAVEQDRKSLRVENVTKPVQPRGAKVDVAGVEPWQTSVEDFYLIDTTILSRPAIRPKDWELRIHGMVDEDIVVTYQDLVAREITQEWITLNCVSNEVGGELIGNAWWSGVRLKGILEDAGVSPDADAVLQTSEDGWTCGTPISALLDDDRSAMLAVYMNGEPLTVEHGFPVRTIVPGLYGYVSACKWVVDMEVTTFDAIEAYWTGRGWSEQGPVKIASRIDVPNGGDDVKAGTLVCAGAAWKQHTGIERVEVSLDGGAWTEATLGRVPSDDTWVQWRAEVEVDEGDHELRVRATGKDDDVQTGVERDVLPDGATGWHSIDFSASE